MNDGLSERYLKKLIGNMEVEDALRKLDNLTQEEAKMAAAELLKVTHGIDSKVEGLDDRMRGVDGMVQEVGVMIQDLDENMDQVNCLLSPTFSVLALNTRITGNQLRDNLRHWLSPPDPSTNYNIATEAHHTGTAQWFFQSSIFKDWQSTGSFLWIHGNRTFLLPVFDISSDPLAIL